MRPCSNFWIEKDGKVVLSEWRVALLEAVEQTGSINEPPRNKGCHFVAWRKIQEMEDGLGAARIRAARAVVGPTTAAGGLTRSSMPRWPGSKIAPSGRFRSVYW